MIQAVLFIYLVFCTFFCREKTGPAPVFPLPINAASCSSVHSHSSTTSAVYSFHHREALPLIFHIEARSRDQVLCSGEFSLLAERSRIAGFYIYNHIWVIIMIYHLSMAPFFSFYFMCHLIVVCLGFPGLHISTFPLWGMCWNHWSCLFSAGRAADNYSVASAGIIPEDGLLTDALAQGRTEASVPVLERRLHVHYCCDLSVCIQAFFIFWLRTTWSSLPCGPAEGIHKNRLDLEGVEGTAVSVVGCWLCKKQLLHSTNTTHLRIHLLATPRRGSRGTGNEWSNIQTMTHVTLATRMTAGWVDDPASGSMPGTPQHSVRTEEASWKPF